MTTFVGGYVMKVKNRRINNPSQIRTLLQEQINIVRNDPDMETENKARTIGYLSNIALSAYKYGVVDERIEEMENKLKELNLL